MIFFGIPAITLQFWKTKTALCALSLSDVTHQERIFRVLSLNHGWRLNAESRDTYNLTFNAPWGPRLVNWLTIGCEILGIGEMYIQLLVYWCGLPQDCADTAGDGKIPDCKEEREIKSKALGTQI